MTISIIRTIILLIVIITSMRIMGKRQMGELEPSELVVAVLISNIAAHPLQDTTIPLLYGIIPVLTLLCCELLISSAILRNIKFRSFICGKPSIIIENGKINQSEMNRNRFTLDELTVELRKQGVTDIGIVRQAILETDGSLSILQYAGDSPVTPNQMSLSVENTSTPVILISNGRTLKNNLALMNLDEKWLKKELKKRNIAAPEDVYLFMTDLSGKIY